VKTAQYLCDKVQPISSGSLKLSASHFASNNRLKALRV